MCGQCEVVYLGVQQSYNTLEGVEMFRLGQGTMSPSKIKPIGGGYRVTVVLSHSNMRIEVGTDGHHFW